MRSAAASAAATIDATRSAAVVDDAGEPDDADDADFDEEGPFSATP
jgi:hypothetical protein